MKRVILLVIGITFLSLVPTEAQWSGSMKADGAWNFKQSNNENADFKLKYTGRKFYMPRFSHRIAILGSIAA